MALRGAHTVCLRSHLSVALTACLFSMDGHSKTQWLELCAEAAFCEDAERFQELTEEITALLEEEKQRLNTPVVRKLRGA